MPDAMQLPLGEVIAWSSQATSHARLVRGLEVAGLDLTLARELLPRDAFSRALRKMADNRVIRQVSEDATHILFQFTKEAKIGDRFRYDLEATLTLNKSSGRIESSDSFLELAASKMLAEAMDVRTASDVTRIVQRVLEGKGDLFPIRPGGGAYFVPQAHKPLVDSVQRFLGEIGGSVARFAVSAGDKESARSVRDSVADGIAAAIVEYEESVAEFDTDTREDTIRRAADRIKAAKFKVEAYSALLGDQKERLEKSLAEAQAKLRAKVKAIGGKMLAESGGGGAIAAPAPERVVARIPLVFDSPVSSVGFTIPVAV